MMVVRIARHHSGIGDWIMVLAALRWMRTQHPDVTFSIDFRNAPRIVQEAFAASDLRYEDARNSHFRADVSLEHVMYDRRSTEPYMDGMARVLSQATRRTITPDYEDLPFAHMQRIAPRGYLTMVAHGKGITRGGKEWGRENFNELASILIAQGYAVRQVGGPRDFPIGVPGVTNCTGQSFLALAGTLLAARAFIGLENGLMVLAGFLRVPQVTIYDGAPGADRVEFKDHLKILERVSPIEVFDKVSNWLN